MRFTSHSEAHHLENIDILGIDSDRILFDKHCTQDLFKSLFSITVHLYVFGKWKSGLFQELNPSLDSEGHFYINVGPMNNHILMIYAGR